MGVQLKRMAVPILGLALLASAQAYAASELSATESKPGGLTEADIAMARAKAEKLAATAKLGAKVCRALPVGIAVHDWIRGVVIAVDAERIEVRVDDPGQQPHVIAGRPLVKGTRFWSAATDWMPCV